MGDSQTQLAPTVTEHLAGHWYWTDLHTTDVAAATTFYSKLFGWETQDFPAGDGTYRMAFKGGQSMAALQGQGEREKSMNVPPHWFNYITVKDVAAATDKLRDLGGTVIEGPFDVMDAGKMSVVQDPAGGTFALWEAKDHPGTSLFGVHGSICWMELHSTDIEKVRPFYAELFGFTYDEMPMGEQGTYYVANANGQRSCGLMQQMDENMPSYWATYFYADDCDATVAQAKQLGATLSYGPEDIPNVGRFAVLQDPQGAWFSMLTPLPM